MQESIIKMNETSGTFVLIMLKSCSDKIQLEISKGKEVWNSEPKDMPKHICKQVNKYFIDQNRYNCHWKIWGIGWGYEDEYIYKYLRYQSL